MSPASVALVLLSVLFPSKAWYAPGQPIDVEVRAEGTVSLVLTDFAGKPFDPRGPIEVKEARTVDLRASYQTLDTPGTYVLYAVPEGQDLKEFVGTPLVISVRRDNRRDAPPTPMVVHVSPLCYAAMDTDKGEIDVAFYYDAAPHTTANFLSLAGGGFYDGLTFHRIVPEFVIQSGDPVGDGSGGPGYRINAEFSDRGHDLGTLSMAREEDPIEKQGAAPRPEYADSGGSQFFICLKRTRQLDRRFTVFGKVTGGIDVVRAIGAIPVGGDHGDVPQEKITIRKIAVRPVTREHNPYEGLLSIENVQPAGEKPKE